ncbi:MAG: hypothetical protein LKG11_01380 [Bacilli bacterium]|jgi:hypothetical protein|nr:hypothetical protein [Bacilli bacterium]
MTKQGLRKFYHSWLAYNRAYQELEKGHHVAFPDTIGKKMIISFIDSTLQILKGVATYDFAGNVELKTVTKQNGTIPFKKTQNNCSRVIYVEVLSTGIDVYDITNANDINAINNSINVSTNTSQVSLIMKSYKSNAKYTKLI